MTGRRYRNSTTVDFVVVGSGASGGVIARELAVAGFSTVVLEQGSRLTPADFEHDELKRTPGADPRSGSPTRIIPTISRTRGSCRIAESISGKLRALNVLRAPQFGSRAFPCTCWVPAA
jgi:choline dehydrogenase-like flavoprotein